MLIRALLYLRSAEWPGRILILLALAGCTGQGSLPGNGEAQLFARGLDEITDLYIEPVSSRRLALSAVARLSRLDGELRTRDSVGAGGSGVLALSHDGRDLGLYAMPSDTDSRGWGELLATLITAAKQASPRLAALSQETIDQVAFDGMTAALDRFSQDLTAKAASGEMDPILGRDEEIRQIIDVLMRRRQRSEERRVGKECRSRWSPYH